MSPPGAGGYPMGANPGNGIVLRRFDFVIQFAWQPVPRSEWLARIGREARPVAPPAPADGAAAANAEGAAAAPAPKTAPAPSPAAPPADANQPPPPKKS